MVKGLYSKALWEVRRNFERSATNASEGEILESSLTRSRLGNEEYICKLLSLSVSHINLRTLFNLIF